MSLDYPPRHDSGELEHEIARWLGTDPSQILLTSGASEALYLAVHVLVRPGDPVAVERPAYQPLFQLAADAGAVMREIQLSDKEGWAFPLSRVEAELCGLRLLCLNRPHNPTSGTITPQDRHQVTHLCSQAGARILSDEVYRELSEQPLATLAVEASGTVSVGGLSKPFGLGGLRIGWLVADDLDFLAEARRLRDYVTLAPSSPARQLGLMVAKHRRELFEEMQATLRANRNLMGRFLSEREGVLAGPLPSAGCIAFLPVPGRSDSMRWCRTAANETNLMLFPGELFGLTGYVRLGFGAETASLSSALDRLSNWLESLPDESAA
jgi:aspartate/methionine/tyrosine aminotransferase